METVFIPGQMEENIKENICMTRNTDRVFILGQMEGNMMVPGQMGSSMVLENINYQTEPPEPVHGRMERECCGLMVPKTHPPPMINT